MGTAVGLAVYQSERLLTASGVGRSLEILPSNAAIALSFRIVWGTDAYGTAKTSRVEADVETERKAVLEFV